MLATVRGRVAAAALGLFAGTAAAQESPAFAVGPVVGCPFGNCANANYGTYGPALFSVNPHGSRKLLGPNEPACVGRSSYPLSDWHYIRQFCGPTLQPGTCYGHFQTKWRRWEDHCPGGNCAIGAVGLVPIPSDGVTLPPPPLTTPGTPTPNPKPMVPPTALPAPGPLPLVPLVPPTSPLPLPLPLPKGTPELPADPGKISAARSLAVPAPLPGVVRPQPDLTRVVVPPTLPK